MKSLSEIRRKNLALITQKYGISSVANSTGKPASQISDMIHGRKSFGEKVARQIESSFAFLEPLVLDDPNFSTDINIVEKSISILRYDTGGSMGAGLILREQPGAIEKIEVNQEWIDKNIGNYTSVNNLCIVTGFGDSMTPVFKPGDPVLIDTGVKTLDHDGVFFFRVGDEGFIKRLQRIPTENGLAIKVKSSNPDYETWEITSKMDFEILGKVIVAWSKTHF